MPGEWRFAFRAIDFRLVEGASPKNQTPAVNLEQVISPGKAEGTERRIRIPHRRRRFSALSSGTANLTPSGIFSRRRGHATAPSRDLTDFTDRPDDARRGKQATICPHVRVPHRAGHRRRALPHPVPDARPERSAAATLQTAIHGSLVQASGDGPGPGAGWRCQLSSARPGIEPDLCRSRGAPRLVRCADLRRHGLRRRTQLDAVDGGVCRALRAVRPRRRRGADGIVTSGTWVPWAMHYALQFFTKLDERPPLGSLVLHGPEYWTQHPMVPPILAEHFAARIELGDAPAFGDSLSDASPADLTAAETLLRKINHPAASTLVAELTSWRQKTLDREFLQTFGRIVEGDLDHDLHVEHDGIKEHLAAAEAFVSERTVSFSARRRGRAHREDELPDAAGGACGCAGLDGLRSRRGQPDGGPAVLRAARRAVASALHGACRRKARAVVRPGLPPARRQRDARRRRPPASSIRCCRRSLRAES